VAYNVIDTPGHGKLREEQALSHLKNPAVRGIVFVVDSGALDSSDPASLRDAAAYLHDVLLELQRSKSSSSSSAKTTAAVLVAANKQDLFTALPAGAVKDRLQNEIERVKQSRRKGLVTVGKDDDDDDEDTLGGAGEDKFSFDVMQEEYGIVIDVAGGSVKGEEAGKGVRRWEEWVGDLL
jgi:signal recognition particle receptor subunit beta